MPKVNGKKFAYTPEGKAEAAAYAQKTGAPFQMRAKGFNNSPMQKNFGDSLAINKKLDKDSMSGGLTGQPSGETGKLGHGPIMKKTSSPMKKGGTSPTPAKSKGGTKPAPKLTKFNTGVQKAAKNIGSNFKADVNKFASKIGLKKRTGSIGDKMKQKYSGAAQRAGKVARPGESQHQFKTRTRKSTPKASSTPSTNAFNFKRKPLTLGGKPRKKLGSGILKTPKLKTPKITPFNPGGKWTPPKLEKPKIKKSKLSLSTANTKPRGKVKSAKSFTNTSVPMRNAKVDHDKNLKNLKVGSVARSNYYKKHNLKDDKTSKVNFLSISNKIKKSKFIKEI